MSQKVNQCLPGVGGREALNAGGNLGSHSAGLLALSDPQAGAVTCESHFRIDLQSCAKYLGSTLQHFPPGYQRPPECPHLGVFRIHSLGGPQSAETVTIPATTEQHSPHWEEKQKLGSVQAGIREIKRPKGDCLPWHWHRQRCRDWGAKYTTETGNVEE